MTRWFVALTLALVPGACTQGTADSAGQIDPLDAAEGAGATNGGQGDTLAGVEPAPPRLIVQGKAIVGPNGQPVVLRGWNWGQWGTEQPEDAAENKAQGATIVRVPLRWWGEYPEGQDARDPTQPGNVSKGHIETLDKQIERIAAQGLWVDLFVDSNCGQASTVHGTLEACGAGDDGKPANFANSPAMKKEFLELWAFLAKRYASQRRIGMYEILSEPNFGCKEATCEDWTVIPTFYRSVLPAIRAFDKATPVMVGAGATYDMKHIDTALLDGVGSVIYTADILSHAAQDPEVLAPAIAFRDQEKVPIFIQQVGVKKSDDDAEANLDQTLTSLAEAGMGWTWWTYREPNAASGQGFAPFYKASQATTWQRDDAWLARITNYF